MSDKIKGTFLEEMRLPDGSGFAVISYPLPEDHWLYREGMEPPPMPFRKGTDDPDREQWAEAIWAAGRYAVRAATRNGQDMDFDPDALCQNLVVGLIGYWTPDGLNSEPWLNPEDAG